MIEKPTSFEAAWTEAERHAFETLIAATGAAENRDAYLGANPGIVNAWYLGNLPLDVGTDVLLSTDTASMCLPMEAECMFLKRSDCQTWSMRIIGGLPLTQSSNVGVFRVRHVGQIVKDAVVLRKDTPAVTVWKLRMEFDMAFVTGGKGNRAIEG